MIELFIDQIYYTSGSICQGELVKQKILFDQWSVPLPDAGSSNPDYWWHMYWSPGEGAVDASLRQAGEAEDVQVDGG